MLTVQNSQNLRDAHALTKSLDQVTTIALDVVAQKLIANDGYALVLSDKFALAVALDKEYGRTLFQHSALTAWIDAVSTAHELVRTYNRAHSERSMQKATDTTQRVAPTNLAAAAQVLLDALRA